MATSNPNVPARVNSNIPIIPPSALKQVVDLNTGMWTVSGLQFMQQLWASVQGKGGLRDQGGDSVDVAAIESLGLRANVAAQLALGSIVPAPTSSPLEQLIYGALDVPDGYVISNISGVFGLAEGNSLSAVFDHIFGSARGDIVVRGAADWGALGIGSSGEILGSNGTDVLWVSAPTPFTQPFPNGFDLQWDDNTTTARTALVWNASNAIYVGDCACLTAGSIARLTATAQSSLNVDGNDIVSAFPLASLGPVLNVEGEFTGSSAAGGVFSLWKFGILSDNAILSNGGNALAMEVDYPFGGSSIQGGRGAGFFNLTMNSPTSASNTNRNYVSLVTFATANSGDNGTLGSEAGGIFSLNPWAITGSGATHLLEVTGGEVNLLCAAGSSMAYKAGWTIVSAPGDAVQGSVYDCMIGLSNQGSTVGWNDGILLGPMNTQFPLTTSGNVLRTIGGTFANGVDFHTSTISGKAFNSPGFFVDGSGNTQVTGDMGLDLTPPGFTPFDFWTSFAVQQTTQYNNKREMTALFSLINSQGGPDVSNANDKVCVGAFIESVAPSGGNNASSAWCFYPVHILTSGSMANFGYTGYLIEGDVNNQTGVDLSNPTSIGGSTAQSFGFSLTGVSSKSNTAGLWITGTGGGAGPTVAQWDKGIWFSGGASIGTASIKDETTGSTYSYDDTGSHTTGINLGGTYNQYLIKSPVFAVDFSGLTAATSFECRTGQTGSWSADGFNLFWTGSATQLWINSTNTGTITVTSDYRIKKNVQDLVGGMDTVRKLRPITYEVTDIDIFKADGVTYRGFLAHEAQAAVPTMATGSKDAVDLKGKPVFQTLVPWEALPDMVLALQQLDARLSRAGF